MAVSLLDDSTVFELSDANTTYGSGRVASCQSESIRCRYLLEQLLAPLDKSQAALTASRLIDEFGSLGAVLSASTRLLTLVVDDPDVVQHVRAVRAAMMRATSTFIDSRAILSDFTALKNYLVLRLAHIRIEQFHVLYLNSAHRLLRDEIHSVGTIDETPVYIRQIIQRALELDAAGMILVHNHPSGDATPSKMDLSQTRRIITTASGLGIAVHDHIIVASAGISSLREQGYI